MQPELRSLLRLRLVFIYYFINFVYYIFFVFSQNKAFCHSFLCSATQRWPSSRGFADLVCRSFTRYFRHSFIILYCNNQTNNILFWLSAAKEVHLCPQFVLPTWPLQWLLYTCSPRSIQSSPLTAKQLPCFCRRKSRVRRSGELRKERKSRVSSRSP